MDSNLELGAEEEVMGHSGSVGLHLKCVLSHVNCVLSVGTGQAWEGQSLHSSQGLKMAKHQKYRK